MKYHTLSTSSLAAENKKSTLTIYTGPDFIRNKMDSTETAIVRCELEMAQRALKLQTRRCRQLVSEFTRKLQDKELQIISERRLRDEQLTKVLRSLLVFEARLKQEQTFIRHQLEEKDDMIQRQRKELRKLRNTVQYCKTCSQFYSGFSIDSCDSSSEYCAGSQDNWESGSDLYGSMLEYGRPENSSSGEEMQKEYTEKITFEKNKYNKSSSNDGSYKRGKKSSIHRRTTGTYFEVLKSRESSAESSPEDTSSDLSGSLKTREQIKEVSNRIEEMFSESLNPDTTYSCKMDTLHGIKRSPVSDEEHTISSLSGSSECDTTIVSTTNPILVQDKTPEMERIPETNPVCDNLTNEERELLQVENNTNRNRRISDTITVFDAGDGEQNDNWYASTSDPEDDGQRDIYRNNPVLECMNQILLQNINDSINSPPKSPELDRNTKKTQKRVKFSDENEDVPNEFPPRAAKDEKTQFSDASSNEDYYETPIQGGANFYEVPQSIYSNDYEQILSKCSDSSVHSWSGVKPTSPNSKIENLQENKINRMATQKLTLVKCNNLNELEQKNQHYYIDMDTSTSSVQQKQEIIKRTKVARTPPALPPKPANLVSKFKMQIPHLNKSCENLDAFSVGSSEPDYCSISELNLPTEKMIMSTNPIPNNTESLNTSNLSLYDPISLDGTLTSLVAKNVEKNLIQTPKPIKSDRFLSNKANITPINLLKNKEPEIPKLPQVSEIIIPEENDEKKVEHISQDNYIKNNSQLLKQKNTPSNEKIRNRIVIGTSVSNLVSSFNSQNILSKIPSRKIGLDKFKMKEKLFSNFEYAQDYDKQLSPPSEKSKSVTPNFETFDLSQNFEEFNLDDCEIGEDYQSDTSNSLTYEVNTEIQETVSETEIGGPDLQSETTKSNTSVEIVRATKDTNPQSVQNLQQLQKSLTTQRNNLVRENEITNLPLVPRNPEPSYEHFLECTGLSSKSILTPARMLSNHKSMLKPKDIKFRSRVKSTAVFEHPSGTVKYWSEPYL